MQLVGRISRAEALDLLHHCLEEGEIIPGPHFRKALADEGLDFSDALAVMGSGNIFDEAELDPRFREWKYRVEGREPGGKWLCIVFSFKAIDRAFLITAWTVAARRKK
jgi:hypothetical protein